MLRRCPSGSVPRRNHVWMARHSGIPQQHRWELLYPRFLTMATSLGRSSSVLASPPPSCAPPLSARAGSATSLTASSSAVSASLTHPASSACTSTTTMRPEGGELVHGVYRPLFPDSGLCIVPPLPTPQDSVQLVCAQILSKEEEGSLSYLYVLAEWVAKARSFRTRVYMLQDGVWCMRTSATAQILRLHSVADALLVGNKIYMTDASYDDIVVLDLTASSLSIIPLPQEVTYLCFRTTLSRADDDSGVYLTYLHANELQLHIWLHKGDNWLLVHNICLHEMLANLGMLDHTLEDGPVGNSCICHVGDNAEFVFFQMRGHTLYLDVKSRTLRKVHGGAGNVHPYSKIHPFMMIWPPTFPALKDDPVRNVN